VKAILAIAGWETSAAPASLPKPVTTLIKPSGMPALAKRSANSTVAAEVNSDGLTTAELPAARAGASFMVRRIKGEFQGMIIPTTPSGSRRVKLK
jgi:hypothetical protein